VTNATLPRPAHWSSRATLISSAAFVLAAFVLLAGAAEVASAQLARVSRSSVQVPVVLTMPVRLRVVPQGAPVLVAQNATHTELEVPLSVAANIAWNLRVEGATAEDEGPGLEIQTLDGEWTKLGRAALRSVTGRREATEPTLLKLRVRLPAGAPMQELARLRLSMEPADGP
jgi:hypothetical protein